MSRIVTRPSTAAAAVFLGVVAVFALVTVALVTGGSGQVGVRVGDESVARRDIDDELRVLAESDALAEVVGPENVSVGSGSLRAEPATGVVTSIVQELMLRQYLAARDEKVTAADYETSITLREGSAIGAVFASLPGWFRDRYTERLATFAAFDRVTGTTADDTSEAERVIRRLARRTPVEVEAEYGRYVPRRISVVPYTPPGD